LYLPTNHQTLRLLRAVPSVRRKRAGHDLVGVPCRGISAGLLRVFALAWSTTLCNKNGEKIRLAGEDQKAKLDLRNHRRQISRNNFSENVERAEEVFKLKEGFLIILAL
jgi:hypothetical protein